MQWGYVSEVWSFILYACVQRRLWRVCAFAQARQSLRCSPDELSSKIKCMTQLFSHGIKPNNDRAINNTALVKSSLGGFLILVMLNTLMYYTHPNFILLICNIPASIRTKNSVDPDQRQLIWISFALKKNGYSYGSAGKGLTGTFIAKETPRLHFF